MNLLFLISPKCNPSLKILKFVGGRNVDVAKYKSLFISLKFPLT